MWAGVPVRIAIGYQDYEKGCSPTSGEVSEAVQQGSGQSLRAGLREWDEAKLVDDEQLEAGKPLLKVEQSSLVSGLDQLVDQRGGGGEAYRQPTLAGCEPQAEGHMD